MTCLVTIVGSPLNRSVIDAVLKFGCWCPMHNVTHTICCGNGIKRADFCPCVVEEILTIPNVPTYSLARPNWFYHLHVIDKAEFGSTIVFSKVLNCKEQKGMSVLALNYMLIYKISKNYHQNYAIYTHYFTYPTASFGWFVKNDVTLIKSRGHRVTLFTTILFKVC